MTSRGGTTETGDTTRAGGITGAGGKTGAGGTSRAGGGTEAGGTSRAGGGTEAGGTTGVARGGTTGAAGTWVAGIGDSVTVSACRPNARANWLQVSNRSSLVLAIALISTSSSGRSQGRSSLTRGGGALRCWLITATWLVSWYGV
jgi:hypothetical protein